MKNFNEDGFFFILIERMRRIVFVRACRGKSMRKKSTTENLIFLLKQKNIKVRAITLKCDSL